MLLRNQTSDSAGQKSVGAVSAKGRRDDARRGLDRKAMLSGGQRSEPKIKTCAAMPEEPVLVCG